MQRWSIREGEAHVLSFAWRSFFTLSSISFPPALAISHSAGQPPFPLDRNLAPSAERDSSPNAGLNSFSSLSTAMPSRTDANAVAGPSNSGPLYPPLPSAPTLSPTATVPAPTAPVVVRSVAGPSIVPTILHPDGIKEVPRFFELCQVDDLITLICESPPPLRPERAGS